MCSRHAYLKSRVLRCFVTGCFTYHENKTFQYCSIYWKKFQEGRHNFLIPFPFQKNSTRLVYSSLLLFVTNKIYFWSVPSLFWLEGLQGESRKIRIMTKNGAKRYLIQRTCINCRGTIRPSLKRFSKLESS